VNTDADTLVEAHYEGLFAFALSLAGSRDDACELTQETFCRFATKGHQLRDKAKVKSWLFTTLYRVYLGWKRSDSRHPHVEMDSVETELPHLAPEAAESADAGMVMAALRQIDERHRAPLMLYYLEDHTYQEIADILEISIGTVMSRLSRAKDQMRRRLMVGDAARDAQIIPMPQFQPRAQRTQP
jgi:RNA polymerase sigma-70 factor, ECF subfamily